MTLDILVGLLSALAQFATAWLGWQVTIKPLGKGDGRKKIVYKALFLVAGALGISAACTGTIRSALATDHLGRALGLNRANLDNSGTDKLHFLPLSPIAGQAVAATGFKRNIGLLDALDVRGVAVTELYDGRMDIDEFCSALEQHLHDVAALGHHRETNVPAGAEYVVTAQGPTLSEGDVTQIRSGVIGVYVAGAYSYSDEEHVGQPRYNWRYRTVVKGNSPPCKGGSQNWNLDWSNMP
jgi:hypothetical protein